MPLLMQAKNLKKTDISFVYDSLVERMENFEKIKHSLSKENAREKLDDVYELYSAEMTPIIYNPCSKWMYTLNGSDLKVCSTKW